MNLKILGEIVLFSGAVWCINKYIYNFIDFNKVDYIKTNKLNKFNKDINNKNDYSKIYPINNVDIDTIILATVDKKTLINLSIVNKYLANIITNRYFWRLRMENRLKLKTNNIDANFKLITNLLDNNKSLSDNMGFMFSGRYYRHFTQVYDILGENRKMPYFVKLIENKSLKKIVNDIYRDIFTLSRKKRRDFKEFTKFLGEIILSNDTRSVQGRSPLLPIDPQYDFKYLNEMTDIIQVKIIVKFDENNEIIIIKSNKPSKLILLTFELSQIFQIKNISTSNTKNNSDKLNSLLNKVIERLT